MEDYNEMLEQNWERIKNRVISPLWHGKFRAMYESAKLDYDDFESLAGVELANAIKTFKHIYVCYKSHYAKGKD